MSVLDENLVKWLFQTDAVKLSPPNKPFFYTSGTIGPYYVNTHFLYGSEEKANDLLKVIDSIKGNIFECPGIILEKTLENYANDDLYRGVIDGMCLYIKDNIDLDEIDCISGGERRDWFFSMPAAHILGKPHITIYKDLKAVISENGHLHEIDNLEGRKILHIADLITEASSYERGWIPAIRNRNGRLVWSMVVVDRKQGGGEFLEKQGIKSFSMVNIDKSLFENAYRFDIINRIQLQMVMKYIENPKESMRNFLVEHPEFLKTSISGDIKTAERARFCMEKDLYDLKS